MATSILSRSATTAALAGILLLAGCATEHGRREISSQGTPQGIQTQADSTPPSIVPQGIQEPPTPTVPTPLNVPKTIEESTSSVAVLALYKSAAEASDRKEYDKAEAALTRALHLDPRNAFIWQALARARYDKQQYDQAESLAQKANSYARDNPYVQVGDWQLIGDIRDARGDATGALQARATADSISQGLPSSP